jgi:hypothetical protein
MRELTMVDLSVYTNHRMGKMYHNSCERVRAGNESEGKTFEFENLDSVDSEILTIDFGGL